MAMQESRARAQAGGKLTDEERVQMQIDDLICDCCCQVWGCRFDICGPDVVCPITPCYERILGEFCIWL